jgi:hypothetical protein
MNNELERTWKEVSVPHRDIIPLLSSRDWGKPRQASVKKINVILNQIRTEHFQNKNPKRIDKVSIL